MFETFLGESVTSGLSALFEIARLTVRRRRLVLVGIARYEGFGAQD
jgi:hypothetical protein